MPTPQDRPCPDAELATKIRKLIERDKTFVVDVIFGAKPLTEEIYGACCDGVLATQEGDAPLTLAVLRRLPRYLRTTIVAHIQPAFSRLIDQFGELYRRACDPSIPAMQTLKSTLDCWMLLRPISLWADVVALAWPTDPWAQYAHGQIESIGSALIEPACACAPMRMNHSEIRGTTLWSRLSRKYFTHFTAVPKS